MHVYQERAVAAVSFPYWFLNTPAYSLWFFEPPNTLFLVQSCFLGIIKLTMELRHLRYFMAVGEALSFTRAAARLRLAQPALSRQIQDLEDEIGVDLLKRSPRGVTLTAEVRLFLEEAREILKRADESVEKVQALARGEYGELHVGYAPAPTVEILPPALAAYQKAFPRVRVLLHDLSEQELIDGLQKGTLELAIMPGAAGLQSGVWNLNRCGAIRFASHLLRRIDLPASNPSLWKRSLLNH